ncbi:MAG: dynamin family protein [Clostridia bacterium]|nr:dynamin family protein [Clostridia bacterium]
MMNDTAYFSWENISELAHLEDHLDFASCLIEKYQWEQAVEMDFRARLQKIREKQGDKRLNISVVGEFSSGKSTFINALLRMNLLEAGVLQGTTVASTIMEYGPEYGFSALWQDGREEKFIFPDLAALKEKLNALAAWNEEAEGLSQLMVTLPSHTLLKHNLRIIDTPGLDATTHWHQQATIRTLQEVSDLSIILVDAVRPLPDSLCTFISNQMESILEQCVFVVTKVDLIPPREQKMMLKFVEKTARARFSLGNPLVLSYASLDVMRTFAPEAFEAGKYPQDPALSIENEGKLMEHTARQRAAAQAKKLLSLMDGIYGAISGSMEEMTADLEERLQVLRNTQQMDLTDFVAAQKRLQARFYEEGVAEYRSRIQQEAEDEDLSLDARQAILDALDQQSSTDNLNHYMHDTITADCKKQAEMILEVFRPYAGDKNDAVGTFRRRMQDFQRAFRLHFKDLKCIKPGDIQVDTILPVIEQPKIREIDLAGVYTQDMVKKENRWAGGGAATGAAIGTMMAPGVGTVIGAAIGFVGGLFGAGKAGINVDEMKKNTRLRLEEPLKKYFDEVVDGAQAQLNSYIDQVGAAIDTEIDRYLAAYQKTVLGWIQEEKIRQQQLEEKIMDVKGDMQQIGNRREGLETIRRQIRPEKEE